MSRLTTSGLFLALSTLCTPVHAQELEQSLGVGALVGAYNTDQDLDLSGANASASAWSDSATDVAGGVTGSYSLIYDTLVIGAGIDYYHVDASDAYERTNLLATVGYAINDTWLVFTGYTAAFHGDGFLSDDRESDFGPLVGLGHAGFALGKGWTMSPSASLKVVKVKHLLEDEFPGGLESSHSLGLDLVLEFAPASGPHSVVFKLDTLGDSITTDFTDSSGSITGQGEADYQFRNTAALLGYVYNFKL
jgi:hypothetical protein